MALPPTNPRCMSLLHASSCSKVRGTNKKLPLYTNKLQVVTASEGLVILLGMYPPEALSFSLRANGMAIYTFVSNAAGLVPFPVLYDTYCNLSLRLNRATSVSVDVFVADLSTQCFCHIHYAFCCRKYRMEDVHGQCLVGCPGGCFCSPLTG